MFAARDGRIRIPAKAHPRQRGPRPIWRGGQPGSRLLSDVHKLQRAALPRKLSVTKAIRILQDNKSKNVAKRRHWDSDDWPELEKGYYEAKRYWDEVRKQMVAAIAAWVINFPRD
jgi:hypothetical protein